MTTQEMLLKLTRSNNELIADKARRIIEGVTTSEEELKYCGSFLRAVLNGDYEEALRRADSCNYQALTGNTRN